MVAMRTAEQSLGTWRFVVAAVVALLLLVSRDLQQVMMVVAVVYVVLRRAGPAGLLAGSSTVFRAGLGVVVCLLVLGHLHGGDRSFPFVPWDMYSKSPPAHRMIDDCHLVGVTRQGEEVLIVPARLFPTLGRGTCRASNYFRICVVAVLNGKEPVDGGRMEKMARAFVQEYERQQGASIEEIRIVHRKTPFPSGPSTEQRVASYPSPS